MTGEMARAARALLDSLTPAQRSRFAIPFDDDERTNWAYTPRTRRGLPWKEMTAEQKQLARAFLRTGLSERGLDKAEAIMQLETILADIEQSGSFRDPDLYYFSLFGEPGPDRAWGWRVEGHHLSLNFTAAGSDAAGAPAFMGSNPARVPAGPKKGLRILAAEEDLGRKLVTSLDPQSRRLAIISDDAPADIITSNVRKIDPMKPAGIPASAMTPAQKQLLLDLIGEYAHRLRRELAEVELDRIERSGIDSVHFAWAGKIEPGERHYYRIHGPTFLVEYDNTQNSANHIHSVWRDPANDFGEDLLKRHYDRDRHHDGD